MVWEEGEGRRLWFWSGSSPWEMVCAGRRWEEEGMAERGMVWWGGESSGEEGELGGVAGLWGKMKENRDNRGSEDLLAEGTRERLQGSLVWFWEWRGQWRFEGEEWRWNGRDPVVEKGRGIFGFCRGRAAARRERAAAGAEESLGTGYLVVPLIFQPIITTIYSRWCERITVYCFFIHKTHNSNL